jgi:sugar/nucleoside kinase (ribokinase family)
MQKTNMPYLCIGHCCHDKVNDSYVLGGTASYASIVAKKLGADAQLLTSVGPDFLFKETFANYNIPFYNIPAEETTIFQNIYTENHRTQYLLARAETIKANASKLIDFEPAIVHLCSIAQEIDFDIVRSFPNALIGATIQGCLRQWNELGQISPKEMDWDKLAAIDIVILSEDDIIGQEHFLDRIKEQVQQVILTKAENGAVVFTNNESYFFPSYPVTQVDATGAGDVFTTAYLLSFYHTNNIAATCIYAHCAASFIVEGAGLQNLPSYERLLERVENYHKLFSFQ